MSEAAFIELARLKWAELQTIKDELSFYEFEGKFDAIVSKLNRVRCHCQQVEQGVLENTIGEVPRDHS